MISKVELINNPFMQKLRILINGEAVSVYSNLEKYVDEPFIYWCDRILDDIYEECNYSDFVLHFQSRKEELNIMEKIACDYKHCVQYSSGSLPRVTSLQERIKLLNNIIRNTQHDKSNIQNQKILFVIPESLKRFEEYFKGIEVKNSFLNIEASVIYYSDSIKNNIYTDYIFIINNNENIIKKIEKPGLNNDFIINICDENKFVKKHNGTFIYNTTEKNLFNTIFECLLLSPLMSVFLSCIENFSERVRSQYYEEIETLQSITAKIIPIIEKRTIEIGHSCVIGFNTDLTGYNVDLSELNFSYSKQGIIRCNGILVEGIGIGNATLFVHRKGEHYPCASIDFTVIKRNRISQINLENDMLYLGEGDSLTLNYTYFPPDADNKDTIQWITDDKSIAVIDKNGYIKALKKGECIIYCCAEQISTSCRCIVKPHLKEIITESNCCELIYGQDKKIEIQTYPEDTIDGNIIMTSMNMQIANIIGNTIKGIGIGETRIIIQNTNKTVRTELLVKVMSEKDYRKLQKQNKKINDSFKKEKKGFFLRLFGNK